MAPHLRSIREYVLHLHSFGANVALVNSTTGATTTYAALAERILNLSASLHSLVGHGDRVILKNLPHDEWIPIFFALLLNGSIAVPVDHRMSEDFFMEIIGYVDPKYIVSHGTQKATHDVPILKMGDILISSSASSDGESLQGIAELGTPAEIIFTSGTWSKPKGAVLSHGNLLANLDGLLGDVTPNPLRHLLISLASGARLRADVRHVFTTLRRVSDCFDG
jgi:long-chain acyl-CoA synthetase